MKISDPDLLRHGSLTFDLQHISRAASHQIVRHRIASFSQQSQRYIKVTRTRGYLKPTAIPDDLRVPIQIQGHHFDVTFADVVDMARQAEEALVAKGIKAEDTRYLRPNAATTNVVMSMSPRQLMHFFSLRCAPDAQWEIRDLAWAMYTAAKIAAPLVFGPLGGSDESEYLSKRVSAVDDLIRKSAADFKSTPSGQLFRVHLEPYLELSHSVEAFVMRH